MANGAGSWHRSEDLKALDRFSALLHGSLPCNCHIEGLSGRVHKRRGGFRVGGFGTMPCLDISNHGLGTSLNMNMFDGDFLLSRAAALVEGIDLARINRQQFGCML